MRETRQKRYTLYGSIYITCEINENESLLFNVRTIVILGFWDLSPPNSLMTRKKHGGGVQCF